MRIPSSVFAAGRYALVLVVVAASVLLVSGQNRIVVRGRAIAPARFGPHDKAAYAPEAMVQYVNPGLVFSVVSATIAADGTISVDYKMTDPYGLALDKVGIQTPGTISTSLLAAYIPKGQAEYVSYTSRVATAVTGGATATQASADSGGTTQTVAVGEYIYTFKTKAPAGFDPTATHRIGIYGSRNLTVWDMGTNYASTTFDFVPAGGKGAGDAMLAPAEAGQNQKPAIGQRFLPVRCETHFFQTAGSTNDDGLTAAQENAETFFFHRRMKTADDAATSIAPAGGLVVGGEDGVAGATGGTK